LERSHLSVDLPEGIIIAAAMRLEQRLTAYKEGMLKTKI